MMQNGPLCILLFDSDQSRVDQRMNPPAPGPGRQVHYFIVLDVISIVSVVDICVF